MVINTLMHEFAKVIKGSGATKKIKLDPIGNYHLTILRLIIQLLPALFFFLLLYSIARHVPWQFAPNLISC